MKSLNEFICESFSDNVLKEFMKWVSTLPEENSVGSYFRKPFTVMFGSRNYYKAIAWDKVTAPTERFNIKPEREQFQKVTRKLNSMNRKQIPELAIGKYKYKETGEYEWFILCSPERYCVRIMHSSYGDTVRHVQLSERTIIDQLYAIGNYISDKDSIEIFLYDLSTYDVSSKVFDRSTAKEGIIYMDDENLKRYRDQMVRTREMLARRMKSSKNSTEIKTLFDKCADKITEANAVVSEYLSNPAKYAISSTYVGSLLGYLGAYGTASQSLLKSMERLVNGHSTQLTDGYKFADEDVKTAKENINVLLDKIDKNINQVKDTMSKVK